MRRQTRTGYHVMSHSINSITASSFTVRERIRKCKILGLLIQCPSLLIVAGVGLTKHKQVYSVFLKKIKPSSAV